MEIFCLGVLFGILIGSLYYDLKELYKETTGLTQLVTNKYLVDEFYFGKIIDPLVEISKGLWAYIDVNFVDRITYMLADWMKNSGQGIKSLQNGNIQRYALFIALGLLATLSYILY